jgi:hypothetical protein
MPGALLVCLFHLNLAFSSLPAERRADVIARCYRPMLDLARRTPFPIAFEASGWTLEQIAALDPGWIDDARGLIADGRAELVGSGYAQCAAPLLPAEVNRWNLRLGLDVYERLFGLRPRLALLSEQAYAPGLVPLFAEAGYDGIVADWDNAYRSHPDWSPDLRQAPQRAVGTGGAALPVVWSESIAFQKFQRYAHGELDVEPYAAFVREAAGGRSLLLYANDAEVFDHRPGRFAAEPALRAGEWDRIAEALTAVAGAGTPALPSAVLALGGGRDLVLEAPAHPIPVKKQDKYNVARWAVTGRDDIGLNTRCWRIYDRLRGSADAPAWRELCGLWASDFRTHITDGRWEAMQAELAAVERRHGASAPAAPVRGGPPATAERDGRLWRVSAGAVTVVLNARRGLAIDSFRDERLGGDALFGTIEHGYFPTIELGADWYSGSLVEESPLRHKVTDLELVEPELEAHDGGVRAWATVATELGPIEKVVTVRPDGVEIEWLLRWAELPPGSLRAAYVTLHPEAFDPDSLYFATHNGGDALERHALAGAAIDHGAPVSALVSSAQGLGATEGVVLLGDARRTIRVEVDQAVCKPLALVRLAESGGRRLFRLALSLTESDDTRRGPIPRAAADPQRLRVRIAAETTA